MKNIKHFTTTAAYNLFISSASDGFYVSKVDDVTGDTGQIKYDKIFTYDGFTLVSKQNGSTVSHNREYTEYSIDGGNIWNDYTANTILTVNNGQKVCFRSSNENGESWGNNNKYFTLSGKFNIRGNINSLLRKTTYNVYESGTQLPQDAFARLFQGCSSIYDASELRLPATTISSNCYNTMFSGCTNLEKAPSILPATSLASSCYSAMFAGCSHLTVPPEISATNATNADSCCDAMFYHCTSLVNGPEIKLTTLPNYGISRFFEGCTSLQYIKCLATNISASNCTKNWVLSVPSGGAFVKNAAMSSWTTGYNGIPSGWTVQDA